ncbi:MAG: DNA topoisomerase 3 [Schwartzia sp.]|nr:DNA topoisomerase 3 [Schwartzia sp. (in: firmicutes)]
MRLYIAEKPSMGREIAKCLKGPARNGNGFIETAEGVVTWCYGHILRQAEPEEYDAAYKKWTENVLPIVPETWKLIISESSAQQFSVVKGLITKADEIVHAGDPDREGQLLVDEVLDFVGNKKPVRRLLLNALDEKSVKEALADLRDNHDFAPLKMSALARARADWLIGMNLSRAYTLAARRAGRKTVLPIGRVKTPTLALVVRREREIKDFHPVKHYSIKAEFAHKNGNFAATWKPSDEQRGLDSEGRLVDKDAAEEKLAAFSAAKEAGEQGVVVDYKKAKKEEPQRLPFALSTLQVLAGKRFGYEPQQVLDTAQQLYERKLTTYPRSDCEYLPTNQFGTAGTILANLAQTGDEQLAAWSGGADAKIKSRAWNDKKITAHHAIIPTTVKVKLDTLTPMQRNIYFLIAQAYLAQFYPVHVYDQTKVEFSFAGERFTASGRVVRDAGWKALYAGKNAEKTEGEENEESGDNGELPLMKKKDAVLWQSGKLAEKETKPPQRFTPSTLLAAMKDIHKFVRDEAAKKTLRAVSGIGTEATRATIIDDLIRRKFLQAAGKKKVLTPTAAAEFLVDSLPEDMTYPDKTAVWEDKLHAMAEGEGTLDAFLDEQIAFTRALCGAAATAVLPAAEAETKCPRCGRGVLTQKQGKNGAFWGCTNFPRCRMTAPDADGKPDLSRVSARTSASRMVSSDDLQTPVARNVRRNPSTEEWHSGSPGMSEEEMAAFLAEYQPNLSVSSYADGPVSSRQRPKWGDKPKYSAAPMERMAQPEKKSGFLCPRCKEGTLRLVHGKNGSFWGCSNYPSCTATFDDDKGKPVLP